MTSYERQLENERYKAGLDARIYSEILIKDLMVSQNASDTLDYIARDHEEGIHNFHLAALRSHAAVYVCHRLDPCRRGEADVS